MEELFLPYKIKKVMIEEPLLGVCVVFRNSRIDKWFGINFKQSDFSLERLHTLIMQSKYTDFEKDFIIFDGDGNVCFSNCEVDIKEYENGIISVDNGGYYLKPLKEKNKYLYSFNRKDIIDELRARRY